jgi:hypothetical protein
MRNHKKLVVGVGIIILMATWWVAVPMRGGAAARIDLSRGRYKVLTYGLPVPWFSEYARLLRERYGIRVQAVAGCIVSEPLIRYVESYNRLVEEAAAKKFGRDVFKECAMDAQENWKRLAAVGKNADRLKT